MYRKVAQTNAQQEKTCVLLDRGVLTIIIPLVAIVLERSMKESIVMYTVRIKFSKTIV